MAHEMIESKQIQRGAAQRPRGAPRSLLASATFALGAALLPKCPFCIAAYLSMLGFTAGAAGAVGTVLRPLCWAGLALSLAWVLTRRLRRRARAVHG